MFGGGCLQAISSRAGQWSTTADSEPRPRWADSRWAIIWSESGSRSSIPFRSVPFHSIPLSPDGSGATHFDQIAVQRRDHQSQTFTPAMAKAAHGPLTIWVGGLRCCRPPDAWACSSARCQRRAWCDEGLAQYPDALAQQFCLSRRLNGIVGSRDPRCCRRRPAPPDHAARRHTPAALTQRWAAASPVCHQLHGHHGADAADLADQWLQAWVCSHFFKRLRSRVADLVARAQVARLR